jgi:hypothetical protein
LSGLIWRDMLKRREYGGAHGWEIAVAVVEDKYFLMFTDF